MKNSKNGRVKGIGNLAKKFQTSIILALVGLLLIGAGLSISRLSFGSKEPEFIPADSQTQDSSENEILVDIEGAVKNPGLHKVKSDARLNAALEAAGGLAGNADKGWIAKNLNLAATLSDGQKIYVPKIGEVVAAQGSALGEVAGKININVASEAQLDTLPGIGPVRAQKIIASRPYRRIEELRTRNVLGEATFEKIKDRITVN